jgi:hypothetical protein
MEWVARITAIGLMMTLPGLAGQWLDKRLGTSFFDLLGLGMGFVIGMLQLLVMTGVLGKGRGRSDGK